jgi:DNA-binding LacI/PurR family transcriptional regulator
MLQVILRKTARGAFISDQWTARRLRYSGKQLGFSLISYDPFGDAFRRATFAAMDAEFRGIGVNWVVAARRWNYLNIEKPADHFSLPAIIGLVLMEAHPAEILDSLKTLKKPMVAVDFDAVADGLDSFCFDNEGAGKLLARRLYKLGHRHVAAFFESPERSKALRDEAWFERRRGFLAEMERLGLPAPRQIFMEKRGHSPDNYQRLAQLLRQPSSERPTAVFVPTQGFLPPLRKIAAACGLNIPKDLTIVGCDALVDANEMTGVRFDPAEIGGAAAVHLLRLLLERREKTYRPTTVRFKGHYVAGKTHARLGGALADDDETVSLADDAHV